MDGGGLNMFKNLKKSLISTVCDIITIAAGISAIYSVVNGQYLITACGLCVLVYLASLELRGKIYPW